MENTGMDLGLWPLYAMLAIVFGFMVAGGLDIMNWILYPIVWILTPLEYFMSDKPDVQEEELELIIEPPKGINQKRMKFFLRVIGIQYALKQLNKLNREMLVRVIG